MEEPLYIRVLGREKGPFEWDKLRTLVKRGQLSRIHEVSRDGQNWVKATEYPELFASDIVIPDPVQPAPAAAADELYAAPPREEPTYTEPDDSELTLEPTAGAAAAAPVDDNWYYDQAGTPAGPVTFATLQGMVTAGSVAPTCRVWKEGMGDWAPAQTIPGMAATQPQAAVAPAAIQQQAPMVQTGQQYASAGQAYGAQAGFVNTDVSHAGQAVGRVPNHVVKSVLIMLCCNFVLGLIALIFALQVDGKLARGDVAGARSASKTANILCNVSIWLTIIFGILYFVFVFLMVAANAG